MNSEKLKKIISCALFLVILYNIFINLTWLYRGPVNSVHIKGFKNHSNVDVVMVGGSDWIRYYYPFQAWNDAGITSYNYANHASRLDMLKYYLEDIRTKNHDAKLYVVSVRTITMLTEDVYEPGLRNWSDAISPTSFTRIKGISNYLFSREVDYNTLPSFYFDIIKYHSNKEAPSSEKNWNDLKGNNLMNDTNGFDPSASVEPFSKPVWGENRISLSKRQSDALYRILDYCDKEKMNVLFTCCPLYFFDEEVGVINTCEDIIKSRGYKFLNFNRYIDEMELDYNTDFMDRNHVNLLGADKFTRFFVDYLKTNYTLTDHRGDSEYSRWDTVYEEYIPYMKSVKDNTVGNVNKLTKGKEIGDGLKKQTDFYEWLSQICNNNFTVIIKIKDIPEFDSTGTPMHYFFKQYSINPQEKHYIGLWNEKAALCLSHNDMFHEEEIGISVGLGRDLCKISIDTGEIFVGNVNYTIDNSNIQVLVYNNHYKNIVDNVTLLIDPDGSVSLYRPKDKKIEYIRRYTFILLTINEHRCQFEQM